MLPRMRAAPTALGRAAGVVLAAALACGCAGPGAGPAAARVFRFPEDTIAYPNELLWAYEVDSNGDWNSHTRVPSPDYARYCFVVARTARQFFGHARFAPGEPPTDEATLRERIREIVHSDPGRDLPEAQRVVIPGYANLRQLSQDREALLKQEAGGWWQSYAQRGNWRMILPFTRSHQLGQAHRLVAELDRNRPPVVHLVRFPHITINHAVVLFGYEDAGAEIRFSAYDPNHPDAPRTLRFDRTSRTFFFTRTDYFAGGRVDVYQIYHAFPY
jgi:hypothetical protein